MSADSLFSEGNEAFVDDDYNLAVEKYTAAIELDSGNPKYYTKRAAAFIKTKRYQAHWPPSLFYCLTSDDFACQSGKCLGYKDAITDASSALTLDSKNSKAFLRKGIALFHQNEFEKAKEALDSSEAFALDGSSEAKNWVEKCESQLKNKSGGVDKNKTNETMEEELPKTYPSATVLPKVQSKPRHDWYQTDSRVVVTILVKNRSPEDVQCDIKESSLSVCIKLDDGSDYRLSLDLAHPIVVDDSKFKILSTKIEVQLKKAEGVRWSNLEAKNESHFAKFPVNGSAQPTHSAQEYPTSSHIHRNWDQLAADIEKEEGEEKLEGDAALNSLFQKIYGEGSDEVKRAMNKSFVESGGTVLSTNWGEVGATKVECKPPDGMEYKKY